MTSEQPTAQDTPFLDDICRLCGSLLEERRLIRWYAPFYEGRLDFQKGACFEVCGFCYKNAERFRKRMHGRRVRAGSGSAAYKDHTLP